MCQVSHEFSRCAALRRSQSDQNVLHDDPTQVQRAASASQSLLRGNRDDAIKYAIPKWCVCCFILYRPMNTFVMYIYNYNYIYVICPPKWTTGSQVDHVMWVNLATSPAGDSSSVSWHRWAKTLICIPNAKNRFLSKAMALRSRKKVWPSPTISTMWPPSDVI